MFKSLRDDIRPYIICGRTDMRMGLDGLASVVRDVYGMDPFRRNTIYLFCGRKKDRIKALYAEDDGLILMTKRLYNGRFQWPTSTKDMRSMTRQEFRWLMDGLTIEQPKAIRPPAVKDI